MPWEWLASKSRPPHLSKKQRGRIQQARKPRKKRRH